jgi:phosphopantetheinyl transferase
VAEHVAKEARRELLRRMSARALRTAPDRVLIQHGEGRPPVIAEPLGSGLYLSSASRDGLAAIAIAPSPVGVDVEVAEVGGWIPWDVLHPIETAFLQQSSGCGQAMNFARLWSVKEAYLKGQGGVMRREPSSFVVQFLDRERAIITDPETEQEAVAGTIWRGLANSWAAVSAVILMRPRS